MGFLGLLASLVAFAYLGWEGYQILLKKRRFSYWLVTSAVLAIVLFSTSSKGGGSDTLATIAVLAVFLGITWMRCGRVSATGPDSRVIRGSTLATGAQMMQTMYGNDPKVIDYVQRYIKLGDVAIPQEIEAQHLMFSGTTGSGKTQAINKVLKVVRARGKRAMIADAGGGFLSRFYESGDIIFNPFDKRSVDWSPFAEIRSEYDCARIAKAAIPDASGNAQEWHHYAQTLLSETMLAMYKRGDRSIKQLLHYLTISDSKELGELLAGTPASILCSKGNDKMLSNTRGIISTFLIVWRYLPDQGRFSVRDWVRNESRSAWLFVTFRDDQLGMLRSLIATMLELGIVEALSLSEDPDRDLWFVLDEVDSLGKVTSLRAGLTKLRKYGCKCVLGLQTISQLRETYGNDEAQTLLGNVSTKAILRAGDGETAEYFSKEFGDQEVERMQWSKSTGTSSSGGGRSSTSSNSRTEVRETKRTVLASEIAALPDLHGYLKLPGAPIGYIQVVYEKLPEATVAYVESNVARIAPLDISTPSLRFVVDNHE